MEHRHILEQPKIIAKINDATRLRLLFYRLAGQYGTQAVPIDNNLARGWNLRCPVEREPAQTFAIVNFADISFVEITGGSCVRIGIGERLMTASGENARKLFAWAQACGS